MFTGDVRRTRERVMRASVTQLVDHGGALHTRPQNQVLWRDGTENVKLEICFTATAPVRKRKERSKKYRQCTPDGDWHTGLVKQSGIMDGIDVALPANLIYALIVYRLVPL